MLLIGEFIYFFLCVGILRKILRDSPLKIVMVFVLPAVAYIFTSLYFGLFILGYCLMLGLGRPIDQKDLLDASFLRRRYGFIFDTTGLLIIFFTFAMWIFS